MKLPDKVVSVVIKARSVREKTNPGQKPGAEYFLKRLIYSEAEGLIIDYFSCETCV